MSSQYFKMKETGVKTDSLIVDHSDTVLDKNTYFSASTSWGCYDSVDEFDYKCDGYVFDS